VHGQLSRSPCSVQHWVKPPAVEELLVLEELRLDAVDAVVAQLAQKAIVTLEKLEEHFSCLSLSGRVWWTVRAIEVVGQTVIVFLQVPDEVTHGAICVQIAAVRLRLR
jgi:hypothetical protein